MIDTTGGDPLDPRRIALWEAVNRYARACGGDTGARTISLERQRAVVAVEKAASASLSSTSGEALREAVTQVLALADETLAGRDSERRLRAFVRFTRLSLRRALSPVESPGEPHVHGPWINRGRGPECFECGTPQVESPGEEGADPRPRRCGTCAFFQRRSLDGGVCQKAAGNVFGGQCCGEYLPAAAPAASESTRADFAEIEARVGAVVTAAMAFGIMDEDDPGEPHAEKALAERRAALLTAILRFPSASGRLGPVLAAEINALPARVRAYIHDLEAQADPAGTVQELACARENVAALTVALNEARAAAPREVDEVREALRTLVTKIHAIHDHPTYQAVWSVAQMHRGPYDGPQYVEELAAAERALSSPSGEAPERGDGEGRS